VRWEDLFGREILIVSGKGGTGKSTVAAALATSAARSGRRTLLAEVEGRGEIARTLGIRDPGFDERKAPAGFSVLSITPNPAAREYLHLYVGLDRVNRTLLRSGVLDQLIAAAPGFRDLLTCGKLYEVTTVRVRDARDVGRPVYDLLVVDAPPTGQVTSFLEAPGAFAELIRVGRMKRQAAAISRMLRERANVVLVTTLEEMAIVETIDASRSIPAVGVPVVAVVANRGLEPVLPRGVRAAFARLNPHVTRALAAEAGVALSREQAAALLSGAAASDARHRLEAGYLRMVGRAAPTLELPEVPASGPPERVSALAASVAGEPTLRPRARRSTSPSPRSRPRPATPLEPLLEGARIVVVCGSGGVGKTTVSAAVAVYGAESGRRTILLTVDPARRLATALGLPTIPGERTEVRLSGRRRLDALQLDTQRTFDDLIRRYAGSRERRDRILGNRYYRQIADTLAGTHEYMAMEKLYELAGEEGHDVIVIDTPPTRSALSFLEAPRRLTDFLGGRFLRWMLWPSLHAGRLTFGVARIGAAAFARTTGRLVGAEALGDAVEFLSAFEGMYGGFRQRAEEVLALLQSPGCAFLVVTAPTAASVHETGVFVDRLTQAGMGVTAVVANRVHQGFGAAEAFSFSARTEEGIKNLSAGTPERRAVAAALSDACRRAARRDVEERALGEFASGHGSVPIVRVPELAEDVHDVAGVRRVSRALFESAGVG